MSDLLPTSDQPITHSTDEFTSSGDLGSASRVPTDRAAGDRRSIPTVNPSPADRRQSTRRVFDLLRVRHIRTMSAIGTVCGFAAVAIAAWCVLKAPVTHVKAPCTDVFGDAATHHRSLHPAWFAAVILSVLTIALPERPKRSMISVGCFGLVIGLGIAAFIRVGTWKTGLCFA